MTATHNSKIKSLPVQLYEVIRITEGIPVFLEDHLDRLYQSARITGLGHLPDHNKLTRMISEYIALKNKPNGNIRLIFTYTSPSKPPQFEISYIPHYYPDQNEYSNGVKVGLLHADRPDPQAKIQNPGLRNRANQSISDHGFFEVLLIDSEGNITEGSKSNVFFIKNEMLYSSPAEKVLQGITRLKIMQICDNEGIPVFESAIPATTLDQYEGAFLTGTSPKVLAISSIEKINYRTDLPLLIRLQELYDQVIEDYLHERR